MTFIARDSSSFVWLHKTLPELPTPIATVLADLLEHVERERWLHAAVRMRDAFEVSLRTAVGVAVAAHLALAPPARARHGPLAAALANLMAGQGITFGAWRQILREVLVAQVANDSCLPSVVVRELAAGLLERKGNRCVEGPVLRALDRVVQWRNEVIGHGSLLQPEEYAGGVREHLPTLHGLLAALALLRRGAIAMAIEGGARKLRGPVPRAPAAHAGHQEEIRVHEVVFTLGSMDGGVGEDLPLGPWLALWRCQRCGEEDVFFFDGSRRERGIGTYLHYLGGHRTRLSSDAANRWSGQLNKALAWMARSTVGETFDPGQDRLLRSLERRQFQVLYVRPTFAFKRIRSFIDRRERGYIQVVGPAGSGKSYLALGARGARLCDATLTYPIKANERQTAVAFVHVLFGDLPRAHRKPMPPAYYPGDHRVDLQRRMADFLSTWMSSNGLHTALLVVDGLDELLDPVPGQPSLVDFLPAPEDLPDGCYVLMTSRPELRPHVARFVRELEGQWFERIVLDTEDRDYRGLLDRAVRRRLGKRPDVDVAGWAEVIVGACDGTLLHAGLLSAMVAETEREGPRALGDVRDRFGVFLARLRAALPAETADPMDHVLDVLALARAPLPLDLLADVCGIAPDHVTLAAVAANDLLRAERGGDVAIARYRLFHDTLREHLLQRMSDARRLALHEAFSAALLSEGLDRPADLEEYGDQFPLWHLAEAGNHVRATELLLAAHDPATRWTEDHPRRWLSDLLQFAPKRVPELLAALVGLSASLGAARAEAIPRLLHGAVEAGALREVLEVLPQIAATLPLSSTPALLRVEGFAREHTSDPDGARAAYARGLERAELCDVADELPRLRLLLGKIERSSGELESAREHFAAAEREVALAGAGAAPALHAILDYELGYLEIIHGAWREAAERLRQSAREQQRAGDARSESYARGLLARALLDGQRVEEALKEQGRATELAERHGVARWQASCALWQAVMLGHFDRWGEANDLALQAQALFSRIGSLFGLRGTLARRAGLARWRGRVDEALALLDEALALERPKGSHPEGEESFANQRAATLLAAGRAEEALSVLEAARDLYATFPARVELAFAGALRVEALLAAGHEVGVEEIRRIMSRELPWIHPLVRARDLPRSGRLS